MADESRMSDSAKAELEIAKALALKSQLPADFDFRCAGPGCTNVLRKPRYLAFQTGKGTKRRATWVWCSQACLDAWNAQWAGRIPGPHWPVYDQDGQLVAYVVPKRHRVSLAEIDAAQQGAQA